METTDDLTTIIAISALAAMLAAILHEGLGHAAVALATGARSGVLSAVAWSSEFDSRLVAAGGTLVNLAAGLLLWVTLRSWRSAGISVRLFLLLSCAFNLFTGTGYFFFSGVTNFGDWSAVISPLTPHWVWRTLLVAAGIVLYYLAVLLVAAGFIRDLGIPRTDIPRLRRLTVVPYVTAVALAGLAALPNPIGIQLLWQSALPSTAGANSGLLWLRHYVPHSISPERDSELIPKSYVSIGTAACLGVLFIFVLGRGIRL
ncbi:MAG: hypothetical protein H0X25_05190 [Acidobacteriales bacterium]|nr:hypothetical protein [Terriglobales bacterium]